MVQVLVPNPATGSGSGLEARVAALEPGARHAVSVAALRAIPDTFTGLIQQTGYAADGDGCMGVWRTVTSSSLDDDGAMVIKPTGAATPGVRRVRVPVSLRGIDAAWFGAVRGAASASAAVQAAHDWCAANGESTIGFGGWRHVFSATVIQTKEVTLLGTHTPDGPSVSTPASALNGTEIIGSGSCTVAFEQRGLGTGYKSMGFRCEGIRFLGSLVAGTLTTAIKSIMGNGPSRPWEMTSCTGRGFDSVLWSDVPGGQSTGLFNASIRSNAFFENNLTLKGTGLYSWGNLAFEDNVSEQGGRIDITAFAHISIKNNLMEGQSNAIKIRAGVMTADIEGNYFESNTGWDIDIECTSPYSSVKIGENYTQTRNLAVHCYLTTVQIGDGGRDIDLDAANCRIFGRTTHKPAMAPGAASINEIDPAALRELAPTTAVQVMASKGWQGNSGTLGRGSRTPTGAPIDKLVLAGGAGTYSPYIGSGLMGVLATDRLIVVTGWARGITAGAQIGFFFLQSSGGVSLAAGTQQLTLPDGKWVPIMVTFRPDTVTGPNWNFRWHATGTIEFSDISTYMFNNWGSAAAAFPPAWTPPPPSGVDIGDGTATVFAINHKMGTQNVRVDVIDTTTFANVTPQSIVRADADTVTVTFAAAPASASRRVLVSPA